MAMLGSIKKVYDIPKPVKIADEIEFDDEHVLVNEREEDTGSPEHEERESPVPEPLSV